MKLMSAVDLEAFRTSCTYDLCHTSPANLGAAMCKVAEAMASFCSDLMADGFEWRSEHMCGGKMGDEGAGDEGTTRAVLDGWMDD